MTTDATKIRDAIVDRLATLPGYKTPPRKIPLPQQQPDKLPQISVFIMGERLAPDGDAGAGEPSFNSEVTIGISDMRGFATTDVLDGQNDAAVDAIEARLLSDPTFVRGVDLSKDEDDPARYPLFEAVTGITRRRIYPQDGETYFAELRLEMTFRVWVNFSPNVPDAFLDMAVTLKRGDDPGTEGPTIIIPVSQETTS
ncbi:hypothetical protein ABIE45_004541 [Methylobacterium sp. OAE515]|uniref:hypothetical protein n=1 Tax=Methylobacterium sp. OAE515 TaxID=2817895 RepID=UPI00178B5C10